MVPQREVRDIRSLNHTEKQQLLERIHKALRYVLDHTKPFSGQAAYTPLNVKFRTEARNEVLVIDIGAANGPFSRSADMSELGGLLGEAATEILDAGGVSYPAIDYEFGGRDWHYYNPEDLQYQREYEHRMELKGGESAIPPQGARWQSARCMATTGVSLSACGNCSDPNSAMGFTRISSPGIRRSPAELPVRAQ